MTAPVHVGPDWDDLLADIGDRIRAERKARGWSQTELGLRAGLSLTLVQRLENGQTTLRSFVAACAALEVNIGDLLDGEWKVPQVRPRLTPAQTRVLQAVADFGTATAAADQLGIPRDTVTSRLSEIYRQFGLTHLRRGAERCSAAVEEAIRHGLINAA